MHADITKTEHVTALSDTLIVLPEELRDGNRKVNLSEDDRKRLDPLEEQVIKGFKRIALYETTGQMRDVFTGISSGRDYEKALRDFSQAQRILTTGGKLTEAHDYARDGYQRIRKLVRQSDAGKSLEKTFEDYGEALYECRPHAMPRKFLMMTPPRRVKFDVEDFDYGNRSDGQSQFDLLENGVQNPAVGYIHVVSPNVAPARKMLAELREKLQPVSHDRVTIHGLPPDKYFQMVAVYFKDGYRK